MSNKTNSNSKNYDLYILGHTILSHALIAPDSTGQLTQDELEWLQCNLSHAYPSEPTWHRLTRIGRVDLLRAVNKAPFYYYPLGSSKPIKIGGTWTELPKPISHI